LRLHGAIVVHPVSGTDCEDGRRVFRKRPKRLRGRPNIGCTSAIGNWVQPARTRGRLLPQWLVNCWASSGRLEPERRLSSGSEPQPEPSKTKTFLRRKNKTVLSMNSVIHPEHRASSSLSKHEGEPSLALCDRLDRTRVNSQRQLPTDHDYAVPTREYQTDQSSLITAQAAARSVLAERQQLQKQPHRIRGVDMVTPYQGLALIDRFRSICVFGKLPRNRLLREVNSKAEHG
jgi:hypothetical protein